jgi:hypothetical protein
MDPIIFRSTDSGAPSLTGQAGSLLNVFDYCLVTGLSWSKPFTGTNRACYRAPTGVRDYLDVNDNGPDGSLTYKSARVSGFETMSAVGTGTQEYPSTAQLPQKCGMTKSNTLDSTDRPWLLIGDYRTFYLLTKWIGSAEYTGLYMFGEIYSHKASDGDNTLLSTDEAGTQLGGGAGPLRTWGFGGVTVTTGGVSFMKRSYTGTGSPCWTISMGNNHASGNNLDFLKGSMKYPDAIWGGFFLNKVLVCERGTFNSPTAMTAIRGRYRGLYQINMDAANFTNEEIYTGSGTLAGKTFILLKQSSGTCAIQLEEWDTN